MKSEKLQESLRASARAAFTWAETERKIAEQIALTGREMHRMLDFWFGREFWCDWRWED